MNGELFYRCELCGNLVAKIKSGDGELVCCGEPMTLLVANTTDASKEKHVPVTAVLGDYLTVSVGSVAHPMVNEHFIEWIAFSGEGRLEIIYLKPGEEPKARFFYHPRLENVKIVNENECEEVVPNCEGGECNFTYNELIDENAVVYAYCNLHGLWMSKV